MSKRVIPFILLLFSTTFLAAQFSTDKLQVSFGYGIHNAYAKRFNHLVDVFNNTRYPLEIKNNLNNINWMLGFEGGANYLISDDFRLHGILKSRKQFLEAEYTDTAMFRQYLFRVHSLDAGADFRIGEEGRFHHWAGGGVLIGVLGAFTNWTPDQGYHGSRKMINMDHTAMIGLSLNYEAQFHITDFLFVYIRPVLHLALNSQVRKLTDFFAPAIDSSGVRYLEGEPEKYDRGNLNGIGVTGGLVFRLPSISL